MTNFGPYRYDEHLESERLLTRKLVLEDVPAWSVFFEDYQATRFLPDHNFPSTEARAKDWIERQLNRYKDELYGLQALILKDSGEFIGMCGLITQDLEGVKELEVGYHLFKEFRGKGYATEAAQLFKNYAFKNNLSESVISIIHEKNTDSQKVAQRNGMTLEKACYWRNLNVVIYRTYA